MGKPILWMGPWESVCEDEEKFKKSISIQSEIDKKALKSCKSKKPEKVVLYTFITNPQGALFPIENDRWGYDNQKYLTWWQITAQTIWEDFKSKFEENVCEIANLREAADLGLYDDDSLPEQFPGPKQGSGNWFAPYDAGEFEERDFGGWKWFGLLVEDWDGSWERIEMPKLDSKQQAKHEAAPKYYKSAIMKGNKLTEDSKSTAYYAKPANTRMINRRMFWPLVTEYENSILRYEKASKIIMENLSTQWTLAVWNTFNLEYSTSKENVSLIIKPEITISLGRFSDKPDGQKLWGKKASQLHSHHETLYNVHVGLTDKSRIHLNTELKKEKSPIWKGDWQGLWNIISDPYNRLIQIGLETLKDLFI